MKKKILGLLSLASLIPLTSCFFFDFIEKPTEKDDINTGKAYTEYKTPRYTSDFKSDNLNKDLLGLGYGQRYLPSTGDVKLLVIPIAMQDDSFSSNELALIRNGFFGKSSETGWESVSSFYEKSSYGKLHITGEVAPVCTLKATTSMAESTAKAYDKKNMTYTDVILSSALSALGDSIDLTQYDNDNDGYIDGVWMVYSPRYSSNSDFYWAYTTWADDDKTYQGMKACCYAWASVDFLTRQDYSTLLSSSSSADAHTFIHETGHMLGLDDYYSYDYDYSTRTRTGNADTPVGGVDMMDFNIGDHDAYSKYFLGWLKPTVLTQEYLSANDYKLTLNSQNESGEAFLLPTYKDGSINYNGTPFDEYLLIEYYTPTGLNYQDSLKPYENNLSTYSQSGILVYHINATVGKLLPDSNSSIIWDGCAYDKLPSYSSNWGYTFLYSLIYNNTASRGYDTNLKDEGMSYYRGRLISLLPATGKRINGQKTGYSTNSSLYKKGTEFGKEVYDEFRFDDGTKSQYTFKVESTSDKNCTLKFGDNI